jgi:signal transduction histidine kinase
MRAHARDRGVILATEIMQNLPLVNIDQRMVRQILLNLISNAVKFSNGRGVVTLKAHLQSAGVIAVSVIDEGIGIPADKLDTVMQPFGQVQDPRVSAGQGTGLGLPLARTMVEMHGGSFSIQSTPDMGTTVTFTLPTP